VKDPDTAEKLTAWYAGWCKRPTFHQSYLQCFNRPNVTLVDTDGQGVEAFTAKGVVACGREHELDALVLATGFDQVQGRQLESLGAPIRGRGDETVVQKLGDGGVYMGVAIDGFPNMFLASPTGGSGSANMTSVYAMSARLVAHVLRTAERGEPGADLDKLVVEVDADEGRRWDALLLPKRPWFASFGACPPTYFTLYRNSKEDAATQKNHWGMWPFGPADFEKKLDEYMSEGSLKGFNASV
ncbi:hypothetical protein MAPG_05953, partial [Magnaporthiopsis poae ATCC 64411]